jgi:hypothetical protein
LRVGLALVWWRAQRTGKERVWCAEKRGGLEHAQLFDALFELVVFVLQLLLLSQALPLLERLVLAMPLFIGRIGGIDAFL